MLVLPAASPTNPMTTCMTRATVIRAVGAAIVFILVYAVLATQLFGLAWPLPRILPDTTRFQGNMYTKLDSAGCKTMPEWARIQHHTAISAYRTVGHLHSAV